MIQNNPEVIAIPVKVTTKKDSCDLYIPDLNITVHDRDYVAVVASAIIKVQALHTYHRERNLPIHFTTSFQDVSDLCTDKSSFPTYLTIKY